MSAPPLAAAAAAASRALASLPLVLASLLMVGAGDVWRLVLQEGAVSLVACGFSSQIEAAVVAAAAVAAQKKAPDFRCSRFSLVWKL